jgi:sporulation protein YlmC with PRC-barrel domain
MATLESQNQTGKNPENPHINEPLRYLTASSFMSDKVYNIEDEKLGEIKDIMIDLTPGKIAYVVIEFGGFLGIGEKFFAVPFKLLQVDSVKEVCILNQKKEVLENAVGFDKDHWFKTNSHEFENASRYWGDFIGSNTVGGY